MFGLGGGVTGWQEGSGIGSGLARPGPKGTVLRRPSYQAKDDITDSHTTRTKLAELVVRFLRLSALVAIELGRETMEDRASVDGERSGTSTQQPAVSPLLNARTLGNRNFTTSDLHANALRPTRAWYFLIAGFLTRSVLEGYMTGGWRGIEPVEILLNVGLGLPPKESPSRGKVQPENDPFQQFDPDDLPELEDAVRILFPSLREVNPARGGYPLHRTEGAEQEYELEMRDRLARVCCSIDFYRSYTETFSSFTIYLDPHQILPLIWKTWPGNTLQKPWSVPHVGSVRQLHDGEVNLS